MMTLEIIHNFLFLHYFCVVISKAETYMATPGEFSYTVVIFNSQGNLSMGILATEEAVITTCTTLLSSRIVEQQLLPYNGYRVIGSNGDWKGDPYRQERSSVFISVHPKCSPAKNPARFDVGAIIVDSPFRMTPYVTPIYHRAFMQHQPDMKDSLVNITRRIHDDDDFIIGGFACPGGICSEDSPMFRSFTKPMTIADCIDVICSNMMCDRLNFTVFGIVCFQNTDEIGGHGCPIEYKKKIIAVGSTFRKFNDSTYLVATRFDVSMELIKILYATSSSTHILKRNFLVETFIRLLLLFYMLHTN